MLEILQIVPCLPPPINGVGDYAHLLARQLRAAHEIHTRFLVCDPFWKGGQDFDKFSVQWIKAQQSEELEGRLDTSEMPSAVLLHYVGYGYQKRGCPVWLVKGLESWKKRDVNRRLVVMFHELYASGPPWSSSFWTSPLQRSLTASLAILADHCVTNLTSSVQALLRMTHCPETKFSLLPVFSNVGEMSRRTNLATRKPRMIVFGSAAWRRQAYIDHRNSLERAREALGISEIVDIGLPCSDIPKLSVPRVEKGCLSAEQVSSEMCEARAGFFTYPAAYLGKSGIFAAYAAHGLAPMTHAANIADNKDGLRSGEHFLPVSATYSYDPDQVETIGQKAHDWYRAHSLSEQAARYGKIIRGLVGQGECRNTPHAVHGFYAQQ